MTRYDQNFTIRASETTINLIKEYYLDKNVVEIGPGKGYFSSYLKEVSSKLTLVEIDPNLSKKLVKKGYEVINNDFNQIINTSNVFDEEVYFFSSLPYSQLKNFFTSSLKIRGLFISPDYLLNKKGVFNCYFNYCFQVKKIQNIPRTYFSPVPRLDSVFLMVNRTRMVSYSNFLFLFRNLNNRKLSNSKLFLVESTKNKRLFELSRVEIDKIIKENLSID